ncbi:choice-of-anchor Q domain-containing protein [Pseudonocardia dioxanivorans]
MQAGSPAINAGVSTLAVAVDAAGIARPKGGAFDLGVFER